MSLTVTEPSGILTQHTYMYNPGGGGLPPESGKAVSFQANATFFGQKA